MDNFLGEIRMFSWKLIPEGWALCDGTILNIKDNQALFSLIGNKYGGDGKKDFALPDLRGRVPAGQAPYEVGTKLGSETVTLNVEQVPSHTHQFQAYSGPGTSVVPNDILAIPTDATHPKGLQYDIYTPVISKPLQVLNEETVAPGGGGGPHNNMQPFLTVNFCIALQGSWPPRS